MTDKETKFIKGLAKNIQIQRHGPKEEMSKDSMQKHFEKFGTVDEKHDYSFAYINRIKLESEILNFSKDLMNAPKGSLSLLCESNEHALFKMLYFYKLFGKKLNPNM